MAHDSTEEQYGADTKKQRKMKPRTAGEKHIFIWLAQEASCLSSCSSWAGLAAVLSVSLPGPNAKLGFASA